MGGTRRVQWYIAQRVAQRPMQSGMRCPKGSGRVHEGDIKSSNGGGVITNTLECNRSDR